jgi:DNA-directed RNA polymerase subunit N (RpoN/RPB10)
MDEDAQHKSSSCMETKARRLYIRDNTVHLDMYTNGPKKKQIFIPIGIICLNCGRIVGRVGQRMHLKKKDWDIKLPLYPEPIPEYEPPHYNRQQKRRADRVAKKKGKRYDKLGIKKRRVVITHV